MCSEYARIAKTVNCYNYSYFVLLSLVKSYFYSVFLLPLCGEIMLCTTSDSLRTPPVLTCHIASSAMIIKLCAIALYLVCVAKSITQQFYNVISTCVLF